MTERGSGEPRGGQNAYDRLLGAIEEGELPPGSRLREAELAERFAISRTPVREAWRGWRRRDWCGTSRIAAPAWRGSTTHR